MSRQLTHDDFRPLVGTDFVAQGDGEQDVLRLTGVVMLTPSQAPGFIDQFKLQFDGTRTDVMIRDIIEVTHPALDPVFLTPSAVGRTERGGIRYEVCFS